MGRKKSAASDMDVAEKLSTPLARRLNELITDANALKDHLGVSAQAVNQYRLGLARPSLENLCKIAGFYGVSTDYLLGITDIPNTDTNIQAVHKFTGLSAGAIAKLQNIYNENRKTAFSDIISLLIEDFNAEYFLSIVGDLISLSFDNSGHELIHIDIDDSRMVAYKEKLLNTMLQINFTERIPEISKEYRRQFALSPIQRRKIFDEFIRELTQRQVNGQLTEQEYNTLVSAWFKEVNGNGQHQKRD